MYIAGFDGGGTKTHCVIGDENGNILSEGFGGPANYQTSGIEKAKESILEAFDKAAEKLKIGMHDIGYICFGMAGADEEIDIKIIRAFIEEVVGDTKYSLYHDSWIGLRAATEENYGVVAICGTGSAFSGRRRDGYEVVLRNLNYRLGNRGGGVDIAERALHYAFRSEEGTYRKSSLENELPKLFGVNKLSEVNNFIRGNNDKIQDEIMKKIPLLVFEQAQNGDETACEILREMGTTMGEYTGGIIKRLGIEDEEVPIVLVGSVYKGICTLMIDAMASKIKQTAPKAKLVKLAKPPVHGAYLLAVAECADEKLPKKIIGI